MSKLLRSSRRPADVPHSASYDAHRSQCPDFVESSDERKSGLIRAGTVHEDGRPNNWDCYAWPETSTDRAIKKAVKLEGYDKWDGYDKWEGYDKWARHLDPKNQSEKSKGKNDLVLLPPMLDLQGTMPTFVKQHLPGTKSVGSETVTRTTDRFGNRCDPAAVHPVSKSAVKEDPAEASSCIWTFLSDLLPQSKAPLDQMSSSEIVTQVMSIRDKLQCASSFGVNLNKQSDSEMARLQRDYLDAIVEILQRQESCYMIALKRAIVASEGLDSPKNNAELGSPKSDSKSEEHTELDVSGPSSDELENPTEFAVRGPEILLNNQRPIIEDHLGHYSDTDLEELQQMLKRLNERALTDCMALPRETAYASSNLSPRSPSDGAARPHNFQYENVLAVGQDKSSLMPVNAFTETHTPRQTLKSQCYGETKSPSSVARLKKHCRPSYEYQHHHCDDADNCTLDCTVVNQDDRINPNDADMDIIEDLSQLMKKRQELESFLEERNHQLKELQEHHDLLEELVQQKEQERGTAGVLQTVKDAHPPYSGKSRQLLAKPDCLSSRKMEDSDVHKPKGKVHKGAAAQSQILSTRGSSSHQKNMHTSSFRVKEEAQGAVVSDKENVRSSVKLDRDGRSRKFKDNSDPWVENPADNSAPDSSELFADCSNARQSKDTGELNGDGDVVGKLPSDTECKYLQKSNKQFEIDEDTASGSDVDDAPNSSLALRDELQHSSNKSKEDYLSECDYADDSVSNPDHVTEPLQNEAVLMKLQFNMSKLVEAKQELEDLRNLLHDQTHHASKVVTPSRTSGQVDNKSSRRPMQDMKSLGASVTFDTRDTDHKILQKLRLLKVANEKLDRLKLVMDDVQRLPGISLPSNSAISPSTLEDRISTTKASNTSRASNLTSRLTHVSELTPLTTAEATERMQSERSLDVMVEQPRSSNLGSFLHHLISDEKSSLHKNSKPVASAGKNNCQSAIKDTVFIRNSLPESVSSIIISHPPRNGSRGGGVAGLASGTTKEKGKVSSKNSSASNISNVSCLPCVSKSADHLPMDACQQDSTSASKPLDKNLKKPCKVIKNQHLEPLSSADQSLSSMFRRYRCGNNVDIMPYPKKGANTRQKNTAVNTEKMQKNDVDESRRIRADLTDISQELKLLRREVALLTQSVNRCCLSSGQKMDECRGDVLDPQLLVGLNQSFQQLLADNHRLLERFCQLREFVIKHSPGNQYAREKSADNIFDIHERDDGLLRFTCDKYATYRAANETVCSSDETWANRVINPMTTEDVQCGKTVGGHHPARILAYMETDVAPQGTPSHGMNMRTGAYDSVEDCYVGNSNRNNSKPVSTDSNPAMMFHSAGQSPREIKRCNEPSIAQNAISQNDSSVERPRFESLSEIIYSEVAVFISKLERRPHYLLELIRKLQKLKTSSLRQQTIDAFDRIISDFLTDDLMPLKVDTEKMLHSHSDNSLTYKVSSYCGGDAVKLGDFHGVESCTSADAGEDDDLLDEEEDNTDGGSGSSCCSDRAEDMECGTSECPDNLLAAEDLSETDSHSVEESVDICLVDPEKLEEKWQTMEGDMDIGSEADDVLYPPDFKSTSSSNQEEEDDKDKNLTNTPESRASAVQCQDLNAVAEQMGFVTVEFANSSSLTLTANSENGKESSVSDESWEETEIPERDVEPHLNGSDEDSSSEIIEEIIIEDDSSESVEETSLGNPYLNLTSISKEEIAKQMAAESQGELSTQLMLEIMEPKELNEMAGDALAAKQPVSSSFDADNKSRNI